MRANADASFRLFIAVEMPPGERARLAELTTQAPAASGLRWSKPDAMHLTLHFVGDNIAPERMAQLRDALSTAEPVPPFTLRLRGVGRFPPGGNMRPSPPRVLWAGVEPAAALMPLHAAIARVLAATGFPVERRAFYPHITLARLRPEACDAAMLHTTRFLGQHANFAGEPFAVDQFTLFSSSHARDHGRTHGRTQGAGGSPAPSPYQALATYPLNS